MQFLILATLILKIRYGYVVSNDNVNGIFAYHNPPSHIVDNASGFPIILFRNEQVEDIVLPHRPNYGRLGKEVLVTANHYIAEYNRNQILYQYDVSLEGFEKTALVRAKTGIRLPRA